MTHEYREALDAMKVTDEAERAFCSRMWRSRGVEKPCERCRGLGWRMYGHGSTWRGGWGTASCERDVCDECWGSGDQWRKGTDLRAMEAKLKERDRLELRRHLAAYLGFTHDKHIDLILDDLSAWAAKQENRRKLPDGAEPFWWGSACRTLVALLKSVRLEAYEGAFLKMRREVKDE